VIKLGRRWPATNSLVTVAITRLVLLSPSGAPEFVVDLGAFFARFAFLPRFRFQLGPSRG